MVIWSSSLNIEEKMLTNIFISGVLAPMEDQNYVEEGYEDYAEDQQYEDYSNMGDSTELSKGEIISS